MITSLVLINLLSGGPSRESRSKYTTARTKEEWSFVLQNNRRRISEWKAFSLPATILSNITPKQAQSHIRNFVGTSSAEVISFALIFDLESFLSYSIDCNSKQHYCASSFQYILFSSLDNPNKLLPEWLQAWFFVFQHLPLQCFWIENGCSMSVSPGINDWWNVKVALLSPSQYDKLDQTPGLRHVCTH